LRVIDNAGSTAVSSGGGSAGKGFKKGGFKSSFASVKGSGPVKKNVLGDEDVGGVEEQKEKEEGKESQKQTQGQQGGLDVESETDEEDYYDPRRPTGCAGGCGVKV